MSVPAADNLRQALTFIKRSEAMIFAADLLDAIDALPDTIDTYPFDGYDDFAHGKALGWEQAIAAVKALLHPNPEEDPT